MLTEESNWKKFFDALTNEVHYASDFYAGNCPLFGFISENNFCPFANPRLMQSEFFKTCIKGWLILILPQLMNESRQMRWNAKWI